MENHTHQMRLLDWIIHLLAGSGYAGVGLMMFFADVVFVVPSEIITPLAGFVSVRYGLSFWGVVLAGTAGSVIGGLPWFFLGRSLQKHGLDNWLSGSRRRFGVPTKTLRKAERWFARHGELAVLTARLLPGIRPLIGIPAGAAGLSLMRFLAYSTAGTLVWTFVLVLAGRLLEEEFHQAGHITMIVAGSLAALAAATYAVVLWRRRAHDS